MLKNYFLLFGVFIGLTWSAAAYTRITTASGQQPSWPGMPVSFWINNSGSPQIANGSEFAAVQAAFQTWQNVSTATVSFSYMGTTPVSTVGQDGLNVVTFVDSSVPLGSDAIASTFTFFNFDATGTLTIQEADIALNTAAAFSTSGETGKYDIQSVLTHEAGHFLGLDHAGLLSSVMTAYGVPSKLDQRTLAYDDIAGVTEIYPNFSAIASLGGLAGTVSAGGTPVFGAHVVALDANGTPLVSTLSLRDGSFQILFLPSGSYRIYAEPFDGPVTEQNVGGNSSAFYYRLATGFSTTYYGDVSDLSRSPAGMVPNGTLASGANIHVLPATDLNLTEPAAFAARIAVDSPVVLTVGGNAITSGATFSASTPSMGLGSVTFGGNIAPDAPTSAQFGITVAANASLGPKNIIVSRNGSTSVLSGGVVLVNPQPADIQVSPSSGATDGGTAVIITGKNFRSEASAYFGGLPASNVQVISSTTIQAVIPSNVAGTADVVVLNKDGTWGVRAAFSYTGLPPRIFSVSPQSGPPGTLVAIEGSELDSRIENLVVLFNGTPAKIADAARTRIDVLVPYGASTGPITVTVLGQSVSGPAFTVTAPAASTNFAPGGAAFVDASPAVGGTAVTFGDTDDSSSVISLPFTFSLFDNIYQAGSQLAVSTNGWLSLDAASTPEFQNGPLPGTTAQRSDGTTGSIPSALIAPFFDDLVLQSGGGASTRTLGSAPNRRFVIEWSNIGILDEQGLDTGAALTFEAILYEGSNDIQFLYSSLSGPRSDGVSATIGIQDSTRTKAVQSGYNQPVLSSGFVITYHFSNGSYRGGLTARAFSVTDRGGLSLITDGSGNNITVGYAKIHPDSARTTPAGIAIFGYRVNNTLVTEAGVPASGLLQNGRIYTEIGGPVNTGLAIANPNNQPASVSFFFTDSTGTNFGSGNITIPANGQIAKFLDQAPYSGGSNIRGTFTFTSNAPVAVVALRGLTNERGEFLITTLPVVDLSASVGNSTVVLPHFADGQGWTTQVILVNPKDASISGNIQFVDQNGQAITVTANGQTASTFAFSIPGRASFRLLTAGQGSLLRPGSVQIIPAAGSNSPTSLSIFSFKPAGITVSEAGVPSISGTAFRMYVEASGTPGTIRSIQTGIAIANSSSSPAAVTFDLTGLDGSSLGLTASAIVPANGQVAKFLNEIFASQTLPQPLRGILRVTTSRPELAVIGLRGRYNERGDFLITTTPPTNESAPAIATPLFFAHLANGGGYTTQFVLFSGSADQSSTGSLQFVGQDGSSLSLNLD